MIRIRNLFSRCAGQVAAGTLTTAATGLALAALMAGCAVGPTYHRPTVSTPTGFKEAKGWKQAVPDDQANRGSWWTVFNDPVLNGLESKVASANQTLKEAEANYEQARQFARADHGALFPTLSASAGAQRAHSLITRSTYSAGLQAGWEPDFWGRIRRTTEAGVSSAQASAADVAVVRLSLQATLANDYLGLRILDERRHLLERTVEAYHRTLTISQNKYKAGVVARSDVVSAQSQLDNARAQLLDVGIQRAQYEHAIAVLIGLPPSGFSLKPREKMNIAMPDAPLTVPSKLLERRPDIALAERQVATQNARVGIQTSAWFPTISLSATGGYQGSPLDKLFSVPNQVWSLGLQVGESLLDWGQRSDSVKAARAAYNSSVANYRQTVLAAFQNVEDNLVSLRILQSEAKVQDSAVSEAAEAARIALNEYNTGIVDYTTVASAQVAEFNSRLTALGILRDRLLSSVGLITALGGGWSATDIPDRKEVLAAGK